jgi:hypothetical protein
VVGGGKKEKSQGNEDSINANDMSVWMKPQIRFCTIRSCDLLSYFISIESLLETSSFSNEVSPPLLFNPCSFFFFFFCESFFLLGRDSTHWKFLGESLGK